MPSIQRTSDLIELIAERAITFAFGGLAGLGFASLLFYYRGETGLFVPLATVLTIISLPITVYAIYEATKIRKVKAFSVICPFCEFDNQLVETAQIDINCRGCNRMIPITDGVILPVDQVRCGFCNVLNFYSEKTDVLLCEECNHEIPIAGDDQRPAKSMPSFYAVQEDDSIYELVLVAHGYKTEDLIAALQHMLALNRGQVKQLLGELPAVLLTGINRKKAEMLKAQLSIHDGLAELRAIGEKSTV
jgi:uncharacterized protein YbaR (Trm112 family)